MSIYTQTTYQKPFFSYSGGEGGEFGPKLVENFSVMQLKDLRFAEVKSMLI
jgi:hypothetical protein